MNETITWLATTRGWAWQARVGGQATKWEVIRTIRPDDGTTQFGILNDTTFVDFRATAEGARLAAEAEMTKTMIEVQR